MNTQTVDQMSETTVAKLRDLARINLDSAKGFELAAEQVEDDRLATIFRELGSARRVQAAELNDYVVINDAETVDEGSYLAALHRSWMKLRDMLPGQDVHAILSEAEYGEDQIKAAYEDVLKETAGSPVNDVLQRQYADVKQAHDRVRDLRDACETEQK